MLLTVLGQLINLLRLSTEGKYYMVPEVGYMTYTAEYIESVQFPYVPGATS